MLALTIIGTARMRIPITMCHGVNLERKPGMLKLRGAAKTRFFAVRGTGAKKAKKATSKLAKRRKK